MDIEFGAPDWAVVLAYILFVGYLGIRKKLNETSEAEYLLSGRALSLPAFVATLVATWYGGILGVGEFGYLYGFSQWVVLGLPFYIFSILFAIFLAPAIRRHPAFSIPEAMAQTYGKASGRVSSVLVFVLVSPAPYILMVALLLGILFPGISFFWYALLTALFSTWYISKGGFSAVVRTDILQVILMYTGFGVLIVFAMLDFGTPELVWNQMPETHRSLTGGQPVSYLVVWFFIALWTFVDPSFHQRAAAAESSNTAKKGILISVGLWFLFDMLTLASSFYGRAILGDTLSNPALVYPLLANAVLPAGLKGLFFAGLFAVIMSTLDSYLFLSGQTLGRDFFGSFKQSPSSAKNTKWGIFIAAMLGLAMAVAIPSVIDLWYTIGSVMIPGLLIPVLGIYHPFFRVRKERAVFLIVSASLISLTWMMSGIWLANKQPFLGIEPFYPGLAWAVFFGWLFREKSNKGQA